MEMRRVMIGGFTAVVERYGRDAPETELFEIAQHEWSQKLLAFMEDEENDDVRAAKEAVA